MSTESQNASFGWFLAGLGLGALIGVLYAPKSGRETREDIVTSAKDGTEYVRVRAREVVGQAGEYVERGKQQAGELVERGKHQASEYVQRGKEVVDQSRAQWEEFVDKGRGFVTDQTTKVAAAVEAGRNAYETTTAHHENPVS